MQNREILLTELTQSANMCMDIFDRFVYTPLMVDGTPTDNKEILKRNPELEKSLENAMSALYEVFNNLATIEF